MQSQYNEQVEMNFRLHAVNNIYSHSFDAPAPMLTT